MACVQCGTALQDAQPKSYCDWCWRRWEYKRACKYYLKQRLALPARYTGESRRQFGGERVHIMQVGLGTFGTVPVPDTSWMQAMLACPVPSGSPSPPPRCDLRYIGVDCLEECAGQHEQLALRQEGFCSVLRAAVDETRGKRTLWCMRRGARSKMRAYLKRRGASQDLRAQVDFRMAYLENMSGIGEKPPEELAWKLVELKGLARYRHSLLKRRQVQCYTYHDVLDLHGCSGCHIFLVDAEGADCAIVKSMIASCIDTGAWPTIVRFETHGVGGVEEEKVVLRLEELEYIVCQAGLDATLVYTPALIASPHLQNWADTHFSVECYICGVCQYPSSPSFQRDVGPGFLQWCGTRLDQKLRKESGERWTAPGWCCTKCY